MIDAPGEVDVVLDSLLNGQVLERVLVEVWVWVALAVELWVRVRECTLVVHKMGREYVHDAP